MKEERRTWKTCDLVTEGGIVIETKRIYNNTIKLFPGCFLLIAMKIDPFLRSELIHINNPFAVAKVGQIQRKSGAIYLTEVLILIIIIRTNVPNCT